MSEINILRDQATGDALVTFLYAAGLVELLKTSVPSRFRKWDADTKTWSISSLYAYDFIAVAERAGHVIENSWRWRP